MKYSGDNDNYSQKEKSEGYCVRYGEFEVFVLFSRRDVDLISC